MYFIMKISKAFSDEIIKTPTTLDNILASAFSYIVKYNINMYNLMEVV